MVQEARAFDLMSMIVWLTSVIMVTKLILSHRVSVFKAAYMRNLGFPYKLLTSETFIRSVAIKYQNLLTDTE